MKNGKRHPGIRYSVAAAAVTASLLGGFALAQTLSSERGVPPSLYYTGELTDEHGYVSGSATVTVGIYESDGTDGDPVCSATETVEVANGQFSVSVAACANQIVEAQKHAGRALYSGVTVERGGETVTFPRRPIGAVPFAVSAAYAAKSDHFEAKKVTLPSAEDPVVRLDPSQEIALQVGSENVSRNAEVHGTLEAESVRADYSEVVNATGEALFRVYGSAGMNETTVEIGNSPWGNRNLIVHGEVQARMLKGALDVYEWHCDNKKDCYCGNNDKTNDIILAGGADCWDTAHDYYVAKSYPANRHRWHAECYGPLSDGFKNAKVIRLLCYRVP